MNTQTQITAQDAIGPAPITDIFRDWLRDCLVVLDMPASRLGRRLGLGQNTIGDFLKGPGRNIRMDIAHGITCEVRAIAADRGLVLPRLRVCFCGEGRANG